MSHVTDIILSTAIDDGAEKEGVPSNINELNDYLQDEYNCKLERIDNACGGNKVIQCDIFAGAINHLNIPLLKKCFSSIKWEYPESAQLMLKDEHEDAFSVISAI